MLKDPLKVDMTVVPNDVLNVDVLGESSEQTKEASILELMKK